MTEHGKSDRNHALRHGRREADGEKRPELHGAHQANSGRKSQGRAELCKSDNPQCHADGWVLIEGRERKAQSDKSNGEASGNSQAQTERGSQEPVVKLGRAHHIRCHS